MWTTSELKERAKIALTGSYWKAVAISLILTFAVSGSRGGAGFNYAGNFSSLSNQDMSKQEMIGLSVVLLLVFGIIGIIGLTIKVFVGYPLEVGGRGYFLLASKAEQNNESIPFSTLGMGFKSGIYINVIKTLFLRSLFIFLWTLCFIIPGIIRGYAYAFVPYILAENPNIPSNRALELSKRMTDGEKMEMFFLDLSFILWWLLGCITCFIGFVFIAPYYNATHAELYHALKEKALDDGSATLEDFGVVVSNNV